MIGRSFFKRRHHRPENLSDQERRRNPRQDARLEWSELLRNRGLQGEDVSCARAGPLKPRLLFHRCQPDPISASGQIVAMTDVWVSDLSLVIRAREGKIEGVCPGCQLGRAAPGAEVLVWHLDNQGNRVADPALTTDENGFFSLQACARRRRYLFRAATPQGRELASDGNSGPMPGKTDSRNRPGRPDRLLHRPRHLSPGPDDPVQGHLPLRVDPAEDNYEVLPGAK